MNGGNVKGAETGGKKVIGITGGVGAGKSTVLNILKDEYGAHLILADDVAHGMYKPGTEGYEELVCTLGKGILDGNGNIDRRKLSDLIFQDDGIRETVNGIIHPLTWEAIRNEADMYDKGLVVIESAIFEKAPKGLLDEIWYVRTDNENRIKRLMESRGYSRQKCLDIIAAQNTDGDYLNISDRVIDNNGDGESVRDRIREILDT